MNVDPSPQPWQRQSAFLTPRMPEPGVAASSSHCRCRAAGLPKEPGGKGNQPEEPVEMRQAA